MDPRTPKPPMRKLVSARRISQIKHLNMVHEIVMVGGWPVVVPKDQFKVEDLVLYFEIDSFLPFDDKRYEPYRSSQTSAELYGQKGWVVQTVHLDAHISQGMVFGIDSKFPEVAKTYRELELEFEMEMMAGTDHSLFSEPEDGLMELDFTNELNVKKWSTFYGGIDLGVPPSFLPDTKLSRAQNLVKLLDEYGDTEFEITEMLDGMPMMVYRVTEGGCEYSMLPGMLIDGRSFSKRPGRGISIGNHDYGETRKSRSWAAVRRQNILSTLQDHDPQPQVVLAGVLCGKDISGNPHNQHAHRFYFYSMTGVNSKAPIKEAGRWQKEPYAALQMVPTLAWRIKLSAFAKDIDELMMKAESSSCLSSPGCEPSECKGLVFKALDGSINFKAISNQWLLEETNKLRKLSEDARRRPGPKDCV